MVLRGGEREWIRAFLLHQFSPTAKTALRSLGGGGHSLSPSIIAFLALMHRRLFLFIHLHKMFYTYIIRSISCPSQRYIGFTADVNARLAKHNEGGVPHTAPYRPWKLETFIAFDSEEKARAFEIYLKSGSGHAFASRHF
jgi:predicted GIY-YIG superfamily endonuclease